MARVIAVTNQKGGVGKTTTCVNLAYALADRGRRVLLVDLDPQGNATMGCGVDARAQSLTTGEVLLGETSIVEARHSLLDFKFDLLPGNTALTAAEVRLMDKLAREAQLKRALEPIQDQYDEVLVDCPPSLSMLTVNALTAADGVLIPIQCEYFALEGLKSLLDTIDQIREAVNPGLKIEGLLRTMFDVRNNLSTEVSNQLVQHFGAKVYMTVIPRNVRIAESPSFGQPVITYDPGSRGAQAYLRLAGELVRREALGSDRRVAP
ncbi:MAG: ParA family protein [Pseudomonadota bacterium]